MMPDRNLNVLMDTEAGRKAQRRNTTLQNKFMRRKTLCGGDISKGELMGNF